MQIIIGARILSVSLVKKSLQATMICTCTGRPCYNCSIIGETDA